MNKNTVVYKRKLYLNSKNIIKSLGMEEEMEKFPQKNKKKTEIKRKTYRANGRAFHVDSLTVDCCCLNEFW